MTTLIVGKWFSKCENCGRNADPHEKSHQNVTMQGDGCGATYTHVASEYFGFPGLEDRIKEMRPDLELITVNTIKFVV